VKISPFPWNACPVQFETRSENIQPILDWFDRWFDPEESKIAGDDGLFSVVHSVTKTPTQPGFIRLLVDLGSAPIEAFQEMIDALHAMGIESLEIGAAPTAGTQGEPS